MCSSALIRPLLCLAVMVSVTSSAEAACYGPEPRLEPQKIADFKSHLSGFADKLEKAGSSANEISTLRGLATADTSTLSAIIGLLAGASPSLQTAIGTALGQAARVHLIPDQTFAPDIQVQSAAAKSDVANTAYAATSVDAPIGSVANGGAGGGVSIGGPAGGSNGNSGAGGFQSIGINNPSFFSVVTTRASSAASSAATSVSL